MKKAILVILMCLNLNIFAAEKKYRGIWWFPAGNYTGMYQYFASPYCRDIAIEATIKDLAVLKENGYNTLAVRIPSKSVPWQRFDGSLSHVPTQSELKIFTEYIDFLWSAGFYAFLAFDWNGEPHPSNWENDPYADEDGIVAGPMYSAQKVTLKVSGFYPKDAYEIKVDNVWQVRSRQAFKNTRTGEVIALSEKGISLEPPTIHIAGAEELGWRANFEPLGGRGFGKTEAQAMDNGDVLESIGDADWVPKYLAMVMRSGDFYSGLPNLVDHPGVIGWGMIGEAKFLADSGDFSYAYLAHDEFYSRFWGEFHRLVKSGSANQKTMVYPAMPDSYDSWSMGFVNNMKQFFSTRFPGELPDMWGVELYQSDPDKAYELTKKVIRHMMERGEIEVKPQQIFVGEWAYTSRYLKGQLGRDPTQEDYDRAQAKVILGVRLALLEYGVPLEMNWGWWARPINQNGKITREEDIMGLAFPMEETLCGQDLITGSRVYRLRLGEYIWQRFLKLLNK